MPRSRALAHPLQKAPELLTADDAGHLVGIRIEGDRGAAEPEAHSIQAAL